MLPQLPTPILLALPLLIGLGVAAFFFAATRAALLWRARSGDGSGLDARGRVYPIYTRPALIHLVDHQPLISGILLGQYGKLVDVIVAGFAAQGLQGRTALITACAFGNVVPRVASAAEGAGAARLQILDLYAEELAQVASKLGHLEGATVVDLIQGDACASPLADHSVAANVLFFLLHELPPAEQERAIAEACRVLEPGGRLYVADFHRPSWLGLRLAGWFYFNVFEPWGLHVWQGGDPARALARRPELRVLEQRLVLGANYQVVVAERL